MTGPGALPLPLPDPPLADGDLCLRPWSEADVDVLVDAWHDTEIERWTGVPEQRDRAAAARWIAGDADRRARGLCIDLVAVVDGVVVGEVGLAALDTTARRAEIGWWVVAARRGRGLAVRSATLLAEWALSELCLDVLVARCEQDNPSSGGVARAAGFAPKGRDGSAELWTLTADSGATIGA